MKLTNREKILLPSVLIVVLAALFFNFVYVPLNKDINSLQLTVDDLDYQLSEAKGKQELVDVLKTKIPKLKKKLEKDNDDILKIWDQPELLAFVEKTVSTLGKKQSVSFYDPVMADTIQTGDIDLLINTDYTDLQSILGNFEKAQYFSTVTKFNIKSDSEDEEALEVSMTLRFYSRDTASKYPEDYEFMKNGTFGKPDLFE